MESPIRDITRTEMFFNHLNAIFYKTLVLQMRQKKTNVAQILTPVLFIALYGFFNLQFSGFLSQATSINTIESYEWVPNHFGNLQTPDGYYATYMPYIQGVFSNPSSGDMAGALSNASDSQKSGLLGRMPQWPYYDSGIRYYANQSTLLSVPYWNQLKSIDDVDNYIFSKARQQSQIPWPDSPDPLIIPTVAADFTSISYASTKIAYILQWPFQISSWTYYLPQLLPGNWASYDYYEVDRSTPQQLINMINSAFLSESLNQNVTIWSSAQSMKYNQTTTNSTPMPLLGFIFIPPAMSFMLPMIVYQFVLERSSGLLEMTKLHGLWMTAYFLANYLFYLIFYLVIFIAIIVVSLAVNAPFIYDSWSVAVPLVLLWGFTQVSMGLFFASFFKSERNATILSYAFIFITLVAGLNINLFLYASTWAPWWYHLLPPWTFVRGIFLIQNSFVNFRPISFSDNWNPEMTEVFWVSIVQAIVMLLVAVYLEMIMPQKWGTPLKWYFPVTMMIEWFSPSDRTSVEHDSNSEFIIDGEDQDCLLERQRANACNNPLDHLLLCQRLHKSYGGNVALKNFSLALNSGECFGLLGPNGAGKTTLISILCGMISPTSGNAYIDGYHLVNNLVQIRQVLGYCPQYDILWEDLTIGEHISFFYRLTGVPKDKPLHVAVMEVMEKVRLQDHSNKRASELSGGMQRRLSIANAMVGGPKLLLLDEPTTGLDPDSRREIWDIISDACIGRSVIVSTHNMDEADVLCTRIGIMSQGRLVCLGNQQYLKSRFGRGYALTFTSEPGREQSIFELMKTRYPSAELESSYQGSVTLVIPTNEMNIGALFTDMQYYKDQYGIKEWGVNQSSLEEVFLRIVRRDELTTGDAPPGAESAAASTL